MKDTEPTVLAKSTSKSRVPPLMTVKEVARYLSTSESTVWRRAKAREMPAPLKLGGLRRWDPVALDRWIANGCPRV